MKKGALLISQINSGGAEHVVARLTYILERNYDLDVIVFENKGIAYPVACNIIDLKLPATKGLFSKILLFFKRSYYLKKLKQKNNYDFVISFLDSPNMVNIFSKVCKCKSLVSVRNYSSIENKKQIFGSIVKKLIKILYNRADAIITVSHLIELDYQKNYKINSNIIYTIYNPYDSKEINRMANLSSEIDFLKEEGTFYFVSMGRQMYQKGFWHLIKAFSIVYKRNNMVRLCLIGKDYQNGKVQNLIKKIGLEKCIKLMGQLKNPYPILKKCDCYVLSSLFEGFPNSLVEGMICGLPIISADCKSGPREILCKNVDFEKNIERVVIEEYGILIPELEYEENWDNNIITNGESYLAEAMEKILKDKLLQKKLREKSIVRSEEFNYNMCREKYCSVIDLVCGK